MAISVWDDFTAAEMWHGQYCFMYDRARGNHYCSYVKIDDKTVEMTYWEYDAYLRQKEWDDKPYKEKLDKLLQDQIHLINCLHSNKQEIVKLLAEKEGKE